MRAIKLLGIFLLAACRPTGESPEQTQFKQNPPRQSRESSIEAHRAVVQKEVESIKAYIEDRDLELQRNGTGIYFKIDSLGKGDSPETGDEVFYNYQISMLNGSVLYQNEGNPAQLLIDQEDAEIGLHESLKMLRLGDKGFFILPSHRAFGVAGDQNKVPPFTALVYQLEILEIQKQQK